MNLLVRYYSLRGFYLFLGMIFANLLMIWLSKALLINEVVFYNAFSEQLTYDRSLKLFEEIKRLSWISYALAPIILFIKILLISFVIYTGAVLFEVKHKISLSSIFHIVTASELVFVIAGFIKFIWFYFFAGNYDLNDLSFFYPISLINFFKTGEVSRIWIYPLQTVNLFHLIYILSVSYGLNKVCLIVKSDSDKIVLLSYLPAVFLWIVFITFLTIDSLQ